MEKVRAGKTYTFDPCLFDVFMPQHYDAVPGQRVRVVNLPGCPKANTMGQCHIEDPYDGQFLGMCSIHSLVK